MKTYSCIKCKRPYDTDEPYRLLCDPCIVAQALDTLREAEKVLEATGVWATLHREGPVDVSKLLSSARLQLYDHYFRT